MEIKILNCGRFSSLDGFEVAPSAIVKLIDASVTTGAVTTGLYGPSAVLLVPPVT